MEGILVNHLHYCLLLKAVSINENDTDVILVEVSCKFNSISPPTVKRLKVYSKQNDKFAAVATSS